MIPTTEAGRTLLARLRGNGEPWDGDIWRDIVAMPALRAALAGEEKP